MFAFKLRKHKRFQF